MRHHRLDKDRIVQAGLDGVEQVGGRAVSPGGWRLSRRCPSSVLHRLMVFAASSVAPARGTNQLQRSCREWTVLLSARLGSPLETQARSAPYWPACGCRPRQEFLSQLICGP